MFRPTTRFLLWIGVSSVLTALTAPNFFNLIGLAVDDTFGSVFPAIPFAALLSVLFLLRWGDLTRVLLEEEGIRSDLLIRLAGASTIAVLALLSGLTGQNVVTACVAIILTFYGTALAINPKTRSIILPYAIVYLAGVSAPTILQWAFGEPLAALSTYLSSSLISLTGPHLAWQGAQFSMVSRTGEVVTATITPGCSSVISMTTFLGLLTIMHMDMKKDVGSTVKIGLAGIAALVALNTLRIAILVWVGYEGGLDAFWGVHNWVGYGLFLLFYLSVLVIYSRIKVKGVAPQLTASSHDSVIDHRIGRTWSV